MMYNLLEQPWLSVIKDNGSAARISLIEALKDATHLQIAYPNPMDRIATLRFILALSRWCELETGRSICETIPPGWFEFLAKRKGLFDLWGHENRFMQTSGLKRLRPITELFHEIPTGNNAWHFHHSRDYAEGVCCNCIVNGLLRLPLFYVSGRPDLKSGINGIPPINVVFWPKVLLESIRQNTLPQGNQGKPNWVEPLGFNTSEEVPLLAGMTVPARKIHLNEPKDSSEACVVCGDKPGHLVYSCLFESAGNLENSTWKDPFAVYRDNKSFKASNIIGSGKLVYDQRYRELLNIFIQNEQINTPKSILIVGFATDNAKYVDIWERTLHINPNSLNLETLEILSNWDDSLRETLKHRSLNRFKNIKKSLASDLGPHTEAHFFRNLKRCLRRDGITWEQLNGANKLTNKVISKAVLPGIGANDARERMFIRISSPKSPKPKPVKEGAIDEQQPQQ